MPNGSCPSLAKAPPPRILPAPSSPASPTLSTPTERVCGVPSPIPAFTPIITPTRMRGSPSGTTVLPATLPRSIPSRTAARRAARPGNPSAATTDCTKKSIGSIRWRRNSTPARISLTRPRSPPRPTEIAPITGVSITVPTRPAISSTPLPSTDFPHPSQPRWRSPLTSADRCSSGDSRKAVVYSG